MSRCKLRTASPIHFKLRTVIGIDSLYWFLKKCCFQLYKCSNSCLWCSCWWILNFSLKSYGKESHYKYCMNVDDGRIMRSWRSCLLPYILNCKSTLLLVGRPSMSETEPWGFIIYLLISRSEIANKCTKLYTEIMWYFYNKSAIKHYLVVSSQHTWTNLAGIL